MRVPHLDRPTAVLYAGLIVTRHNYPTESMDTRCAPEVRNMTSYSIEATNHGRACELEGHSKDWQGIVPRRALYRRLHRRAHFVSHPEPEDRRSRPPPVRRREDRQTGCRRRPGEGV